MAKSSGPNYIDGFQSVQAVKHSKKGRTGPKTRPSRTTLPALEKPAADKKSTGKTHAKRISHSVMPEKFTITCYECEYVYALQGRVVDNFCPKCHEKLIAKDITIEKSRSKDIKTIGRVEIKKGAEIKKCKIVTRALSLASDASEAELCVYSKLELLSGARFNVPKTVIRTLVVPKKASVTIKGKVSCESLEVFGTIKANLHCSGQVTLENGGKFNGSIEAPSLVVYEGAGLKAKLKIGAGRK